MNPIVRELMGVDTVYDEDSEEEKSTPLDPPLMTQEAAERLMEKHAAIVEMGRRLRSNSWYIAGEIVRAEEKEGQTP